jgi:hypothetical protein
MTVKITSKITLRVMARHNGTMASTSLTTSLAIRAPRRTLRDKASDAILGLVVNVPASREPDLQDPLAAQQRSQTIARVAARRASVLAGSMALPPGPLGWLTFLPELVAVWKLQGQMVADIAGVYGKSASLSREHMLYCLFKHVSAQALRDVVVRVGERFLVQRASSALMQNIAQKIGLQLTQKMVGKSLSRFVPLIGAVGVGAYAYFDTTQVGKSAIDLFSHDVDTAPAATSESAPDRSSAQTR